MKNNKLKAKVMEQAVTSGTPFKVAFLATLGFIAAQMVASLLFFGGLALVITLVAYLF